MSKNIIIKQDGVAQSLNNVPKLTTSLLDEGSCTWIPEDEANDYATTTTLSTTENGTYGPDEGYAGFSEVTVNVNPTLTTKPIFENGTYNAADDQADGYSSVNVNVAPTLTAKYITANGTYNAEDEQADGYSSVDVQVPTASNLGPGYKAENGTYLPADDGLDGYDSFTAAVVSEVIDDKVIEIDDPDDPAVWEITPVDETEGVGWSVDTDTGTSSILITDPDDGEKYIVSVEPDGTITKTLFPTKMVITTPPTKTTYTEGETMDYTGIVVTLYDKAGNVYTDDVYTTGVIPFSELEFPVSVAPHVSGNPDEYIGGGVVAQRFSTIHGYYKAGGTLYDIYVTDSPVCVYNGKETYLGGERIHSDMLITQYNGDLYALKIQSELSGQMNGYQLKDDGTYTVVFSTSAAAGYPTFTQCSLSGIDSILVPESTVDPSTFSIDDLTPEGIADIPVKWASPQPHFPVKAKFQEYFEIEVTDA